MSRPGPQHCARSTRDSDTLLTPLYIPQHPRSRDGRLAWLAVATSRNLVHWEKRGLVFANSQGGRYKDIWSKSGAIICRRAGDHLIAARIDGLYWMYWGEADIYIATSDNLIDWEPLVGGGALRYLFGPRRNRFDSALVEPGPPADED